MREAPRGLAGSPDQMDTPDRPRAGAAGFEVRISRPRATNSADFSRVLLWGVFGGGFSGGIGMGAARGLGWWLDCSGRRRAGWLAGRGAADAELLLRFRLTFFA